MSSRKLLLFALALCFSRSQAQVFSLKGKEAFVPGEILVRFKEGVSDRDRVKTMASLGRSKALSHPRLFKVTLNPGLDVLSAVEQIRGASSILYAQPNYRYYALGVTCSLPTDNVDGYVAASGWPFLKIQMNLATTLFNGWPSCPPGAASVTVAVLDTGISRNNPDLKGVPLDGYNAVAASGLWDSSCNGSFYSSVTLDSAGVTASMDDFGHGTYVSGIIGAVWNGSTPNTEPSCSLVPTSGFAGVAPGSSLLAVKVLDCTGGGSTESIVLGTDYAVSKGAKVLNFSLGSPSADGLDPAEQEALDNAEANNCVVVASAGNDSYPGHLAAVNYPAAYPPVVSVGATDENDAVASYSNGGGNLKLVAPGGSAQAFSGSALADSTNKVFSDFLCPLSGAAITEGGFETSTDQNFGVAAGTSAAAPFVSAAAALLFSAYPGFSNTQVVNAILNNTDSLNGNKGWDAQTGYGRLNVYQALLNAGTGGGQATNYLTTFNSPNPFYTGNISSTNITLAITAPAPVDLTIYDSAGRVVLHKHYDFGQLNNNPSNPQFKSYYVSWDGRNGAGQPVVTGIYFYEVDVNGQIGRNKIALIQGSK